MVQKSEFVQLLWLGFLGNALERLESPDFTTD